MNSNHRTDDTVVDEAYWHTRNGAYIRIHEESDFPRLEQLARAEPVDWTTVTAREVVAQVWDQMGMYRLSCQIATLGIGELQLEILRSELKGAEAKEVSRLAQARAGLVLQCAIVEIRRNEVHRRKIALDLITQLIELLGRGPQHGRLQILIWIMFWKGRILSLDSIGEAATAFRQALDLADRNLEWKLIRDHGAEVKRSRQVAAANYLISAIMGFGLALVRQLAMDHIGALDHLAVAIPLARGNEDYYRLGFVHYLKGVSLRSLAQSETGEWTPGEARHHLHIAYASFGGRDRSIIESLKAHGVEAPSTHGGKPVPPHYLHLARTLHQLALLDLNGQGSLEDLRSAWSLNEEALRAADAEDCREFRDPMLDYGIRVVRSLARAGLARHGEGTFQEAERDADIAIQALATGRIATGMSGSCFVAKGRAIAEATGGPLSQEAVAQATEAFEKALAPEIRATERAAAHLYLARIHLRRQEISAAALHYDQGQLLVEHSEHGWVRRLAEQVGAEIGDQRTPFIRFNVADELARLATTKGKGKKKKEVWKNLSDHVLSQLREQVLRLYQEDLKQEGGVSSVATKLGVSPAAIYGWLKEDRYAHHRLGKNPQKKRGKSQGPGQSASRA